MFGRRTTSEQPASPAEDAAISVAPSHADIEQLWSPSQARARKSIEQLLLDRGQISEEQLAQAKQVQNQTPGKTLTQILLTMSAASEAQILDALAETLGLPYEI